VIQSKIEHFVANDPTINLVIAGDFNFVFSPQIDSIGRNQSKKEAELVNVVENFMLNYSLCDSYRVLNNYGGFTWGKNNPKYIRSRLDHILVSKRLSCNIKASTVTYEFNESDHQYLYTELLISEMKYGPGIQRVNATLLECPEIKSRIIGEINSKMEEIPSNWNPHQTLDYFKFSLRTIMLKEGKIKSKLDKNRLELSNSEINKLKLHLDNKLLEFGIDQTDDQKESLDSIKDAIEIAESEIKDLKDQEAKRLIFKSRAKWAEEGEKSNKYFLNLLKERQKKMQIRKIVSNGKTYYKQDEISKAICNFYKKLYKKQNVEHLDPNDTMFNSLPKLNDTDKNVLENPLTLDELYQTLLTCNESAPGPDGITYDTYKGLWSIAGPIILDAWLHSCKKGSTSNSQKQAVISLLEKKGKDRTIIENLRPISLSNCDIKICTKAIALRTNKILGKLINITQTGYVPGRQVTDNIRLLEEVIERANEIKEKAYLVTLDAQKAFDSVDHKYLLKILEMYGFPPTYISWIKLLYKDLQATVLVNGFTTEWFNIEQSVKQGDALSCALFLLAIEPLIDSIRKNDKIPPVTITCNTTNNTTEINEASFADDITALTTSRDGIQIIINEYNKFSKYSGIQLNVPKTEIMVIGKHIDDPKNEIFDIYNNGGVIRIVEQDMVKICGISFSNNNELSYKENITNKITKLERQLDIWRTRNLTLEGKILIVKTFGLSQLIYSLQSTFIAVNDLKQIDQIIFRFIWSIKKSCRVSSGKISREVMKLNYEHGGLKAPSIVDINDSIKYKTLIRHFGSKRHPVSTLYHNKLSNFGLQWSSYHSNFVDNSYIGNAVKVHIRFGKLLQSDIKDLANQDDGIHKNYYSYIQNTNLMCNPFINIHQASLLRRLMLHNINTLNDLHKEIQLNRFPNLFLEKQQIYNSFPLEWRKLLIKTNRTHPIISNEIPVGLNKWQNINNITIRDIKNRLAPGPNLNPETYLTTRHREHINIQRNPFSQLRIGQKDVKLRNIQFKILHNIYPTMKHLFTWKIKDTPNCSLCTTTESLRHAIYECPVAASSWVHFNSILNINTTFTYDDVLLGISSTNNVNLSRNKLYTIDTLMVLMKQRLILQREDKRHIERNEVISLILDRLRLEKYNSIKYKREIKYNVKWKWIEDIME